MSEQPRRRRRRGRRGRGGGGGQPNQRTQNDQQGKAEPQRARAASSEASGGSRKRRRRRGRGGSGGQSRGPSFPSPKLSEDLFRLLVEKETLTLQSGAPDDTILEDVIGDLQSSWGVPQYPQEYRITIKVADKPSANGSQGPADKSEERSEGTPKREKAPSPARMAAKTSGDGTREQAPRRRNRRRGRRRRGGGAGSGSS